MSEKLVTIWTSPDCGPCKMLKAKLGTVAEPKVDFNFEYKDVYAEVKEAQAANIRSVPTIIITDNTGMLKTMVGAGTDVIQQIEKWVK